MSLLPPLVLDLRAHAAQLYSELGRVSGEVTKMEKQTDASTTRMSHAFNSASGSTKAIGTGIALAAVAVGVESLRLATSFQTATTQLVTGAGESEDKIKMVTDGLLKMAPAVGIGPTALAKAMFLVESAGYHGAEGLKVMQAAAEGAKVGGADATVVANALTTVMKDYGPAAGSAAKVTSELVATVASGKTNMTDLAGALSAIAPKAQTAGISLSEMLGAMGTMTGEGISAQDAANKLSGSIDSLQKPTSEQTKAMAQMGLSSLDIAKNLGKNGLTGTFDTMATAVMQHMGPAGLVLQSSFNQSKLAASSAREELSKLPKSLQDLGQKYLEGKVKASEWSKAIKGQDALSQSQAKHFATLAKSASGFSDQLSAGGGSASTFNGIISAMTGGSTGLGATLALTGTHMNEFRGNVKSIGGASVEAGGHVKGWSLTQKDLSVQMEQASAKVQVIGVKIGTFLIPMVSAAISAFGKFTDWMAKNKTTMIVIGAVIGGVLVAAMVAYTASAVAAAIASTLVTWPFIIIIAVIALVVAAVIWLIANWDMVVKFVKNIWIGLAKFLVSVGDAIVGWWKGFFTGIGNFAKAIFQADLNIVRGIFQGVHDFFTTIGGAIGTAWHNIWSGLGDVVRGAFSGVQSFIRDVMNGVVGIINGAIDGINTLTAAGAAVGINVPRIPHMPHFDIGTDRVPGATGQPMAAVIHGGEVILSNDMLNGQARIGPRAVAAVGAQTGGFGGTSGSTEQRVIHMTNNFNTNADSTRITHDIGWLIRRQG